MRDFLKILTGKDGPLIFGLTAITALTLGWKFFDANYTAEGKGWKIYHSASDLNPIGVEILHEKSLQDTISGNF